MTAALALSDLSYRYPGQAAPAVDGIDLRVEEGACTVLLGPSGSGKSTVLRLVAGLATPDGGDIAVGGRSVSGLAPDRRGMAMVFQRPALFAHLSVLDNVAFAARMRGVPRDEARHAAARYLDLVRLEGLGARSTRTLSGGQAQRVALARALAAEPGVLLLDEPFSALDPSLTSEMHDLLDEVRAILGPTILMVTHDQAEAARLGDTVAVLVEGRLLQHDRPDRLYTRPGSLAVHRFLGGLVEIPGHMRDGRHLSALGVWQVAVDVPPITGPATLVLRHEALELAAASSSDVRGVVVRTRPAGVRQLVEVATDAGTFFVETADRPCPRPGSTVGINVPVAARSVVPAATTPSIAAAGSAAPRLAGG